METLFAKNRPKDGPVMATGAVKFSMRGLPLLSEGATFDPVATADNLWLSVKVYSSGGENAFHAHHVEDHAFVVLQGKATFYFPDGDSCEALPFEGVMLPKSTMYRFEASEEENLVMLRIGAAQRTDLENKVLREHGSPLELGGLTFDLDGSRKDSTNAKTGTPSRPVVKIPGKYFPAR